MIDLRKRLIVFDDDATKRRALKYAWGRGQRWLLSGEAWDVDGEKCKLRQRLEEAGFEFEAIGHEFVGGPVIYRISDRDTEIENK